MTKLSMSEEEMLKRKYTRPYEKRIADLEEKISILLSCKNCSENKGGFICAKEYEGKCLAQKIEYIKELQKENAELKTKKIPQLERRIASIRGSHSVDVKKLNARTEQVERLKKENADLQKSYEELYNSMRVIKDQRNVLEKENAELKAEKGCETCTKFDEVKLTKAKELLKQWLQTSKTSGCDNINIVTDAEQFLNSEEK